MQFPHVVAVVVTGKSKEHVERFLPVCLTSLQEQSYPPELLTILLVSEQQNSEFLKQFTRSRGFRVSAVFPQMEAPTLGDLRNTALEWCKATHPDAYVIQCDDDDYHGVDRIRLQIEAALTKPGSPSLLKRQLCYSWDTDVAFIRELKLYKGPEDDGRPTPLHGTICHPPTNLRYPSLPKGEDTPFFLGWKHFVEIDNPPELYVRFAHDASTSPHDHVMQDAAQWRPGTWAIPTRLIPFLKDVLAKYPVYCPDEPAAETPEKGFDAW